MVYGVAVITRGVRAAAALIAGMLLAGCFLVALPRPARAEVLVIATGEYKPYCGDNLPHYGFVNHVIEKAFREVGREVRFEFYPWARSFDLALSGAVQAVSYAYGAGSREREFLLSDPITHERMVVFHRKGRRMPEWNSLRDLHGNVIGVTRSFAYTDELWDLARQGVFTLNVANTDQLNFAKLLDGRIDLFIAAEMVGYRILRTRFSPNEVAVLASTAKAVVDHHGYLAFSRVAKGGEKLREEFNRGLRILKETGAYEVMYQDLLNGRYDEGVTW